MLKSLPALRPRATLTVLSLSPADEKHFEDNLEELRLRWRIEVAPAAPQNLQPQRARLEQSADGREGEAASGAPSAAAAAGAPAAA